jgi:hypothetical protein
VEMINPSNPNGGLPSIWETISPSALSKWILTKQYGPPPEAYKLLGPPSIREVLKTPLLASLTPYIHIHPESGAIDVKVPDLPSFTEETVRALSLEIVGALDSRQAFEWTHLDEEEKGSPDNVQSAVGKEYWLSVNYIHPVGPGGRITYYPRRRLVEIIVRRRGKNVHGYWRKPTEVADRVLSYLEIGDAPETRLRARFGYYETSKYESQSLLRPVFLFLLDRPTAKEGPRWRVSTVEAATELPRFPATAGIDSVTGCA